MDKKKKKSDEGDGGGGGGSANGGNGREDSETKTDTNKNKNIKFNDVAHTCEPNTQTDVGDTTTENDDEKTEKFISEQNFLDPDQQKIEEFEIKNNVVRPNLENEDYIIILVAKRHKMIKNHSKKNI